MTGTVDENDDVALVGEYALHLMDADERRAFERRLNDEPALRGLLREWDEGLIPLAEQMPPVEAPAHLKGKIDAVLFPAAKSKGRLSWLKLGGGILTGGVFAVLLLLALPTPELAPTGPAYLAEVVAEDQSLIVQASLEPGTNRLTLSRETGAAIPGRALELWLIAKDATAPVSLGVLPDGPDATIELPDTMLALLEGGTLAISDEPLGGSPTGQPTGAVLAVGAVTLL